MDIITKLTNIHSQIETIANSSEVSSSGRARLYSAMEKIDTVCTEMEAQK